MPRNLSPSALEQTLAGQLAPAYFLCIEFLTETVYLWSGLGTITPAGPAYDPTASFPYGQTFTGMGWMGAIRAVPEVTDVVASNITLSLSGIPSELVTDALDAVRQNSVATLWLGFMSLAPGNPSVVLDPVQVFQGALDVPTVTEGSTTCSISITCENPLIDLNRSPDRRYTDVDQQIDYPGDTGFFQVQLLQDFLLLWPSPFATPDESVIPPNYLTITPGQTASVPVAVGATVQLTCTETRSNGSTQVVMGPGQPAAGWGGSVYSNDPSIATVDTSGVVTGLKQGMCTITKRYVESEFTGSSSERPSNCVTASVTVIVTEAA